jgi:hypothetical protein
MNPTTRTAAPRITQISLIGMDRRKEVCEAEVACRSRPADWIKAPALDIVALERGLF